MKEHQPFNRVHSQQRDRPQEDAQEPIYQAIDGDDDYEQPLHQQTDYVTSDSPAEQEYEMPQQAYTRSMLAKFKNLEDSNLPPPSPERSANVSKQAVASSKFGVTRTMPKSSHYGEPDGAATYPDEREQPDGDEYEDEHQEHQEFQFKYDSQDVEEGEFENDPYHDPNVIREADRQDEEELPEQGTTRNLLAKFKAMQANAY